MEVPTTGPYHIEPRVGGLPVPVDAEYANIEDAEWTLERLQRVLPYRWRVVDAAGEWVPQLGARELGSLKAWTRDNYQQRRQPVFSIPYLQGDYLSAEVCETDTIKWAVMEFHLETLALTSVMHPPRYYPVGIDQFGHMVCWNDAGRQFLPQQLREWATPPMGERAQDAATLRQHSAPKWHTVTNETPAPPPPPPPDTDPNRGVGGGIDASFFETMHRAALRLTARFR